MNVIVSSKLEDNYTNFKVVRNFKWVEENMNEISVLIFHCIDESDFNTGVHISRLRTNSSIKFLYINENPQTTIKMVITGTGGKIITDEFYFDDEEELLELLKNCSLSTETQETSLATVSLQVVKDFIESFTRGEERIKTPAYLDMVNNAITELSTITKKQEIQITTMGNSAIEIFGKAFNLIKNLEEKRVQIEEQLKVLENNQDNGSLSNSNTFNSNVSIYPPVRYLNTAPLLLIREYSPCRYLTSFALGYTHHVHFVKSKRVKLIMVHQKGAGVSKKYSEFTAINEESAGYATLYNSEYIATNTPKKDILREIFKQPVDAFIVVDRLYGNQDIISGKISKLNAVGGLSDLERYSLKPEDTLVSIRKDENIFATLSTVKNYPSEIDARHAAYEQAYEEVYSKLDMLLGIE